MIREERKREKRLPPPASELHSDRNHPLHEAAPFYSEDLISYDYQDSHALNFSNEPRGSVPYENRHSLSHPFKSLPPRDFSKEIMDLKEKNAYLDAELQNFKVKFNILSKDNERLQEEIYATQSERKITVLESEIERISQENELKNKQLEHFDKILKSERAKYHQESQELKNTLKLLKENQIRESHLNESNKGKAEIFELKEENKKLKQEIENLSYEKKELLRLHEEEIEYLKQYYEEEIKNLSEMFEKAKIQQYDEKNKPESPKNEEGRSSPIYHSQWGVEKSEPKNYFDLDQGQSFEKSEENVENQEEPENQNNFEQENHEEQVEIHKESEKSDHNSALKFFADQFDENIDENNYFSRENFVTDLQGPEFIPENTVFYAQNFENTSPAVLFDSFPEVPNNTGLTSLFDTENPSNLNQEFDFNAVNPSQISNLFDVKQEFIEKQEENSSQSDSKNWFNQEPNNFNGFNQVSSPFREQNSNNAEDFFNSVNERSPDSRGFQTVPRSLFD